MPDAWPAVHNALDAEHCTAISNAWMTVHDDPQIRCATPTGASIGAFSVGACIKSMLTKRNAWAEVRLTHKDQLLNRGPIECVLISASPNRFMLVGPNSPVSNCSVITVSAFQLA